MDIQILEFTAGAGQAKGLTVIIDVFRAFSLECYLFGAGAEEIYAVGKEETARELKKEHPEYVLIGERGGKILPGFDYGNSPSQTKEAKLTGKTVIHTTSAGTQGLVNAKAADQIITGSLVNAKAIARYIKKKNPDTVSLVAMGLAGQKRAPEDLLCARYIKSLLEGSPMDMDGEIALLKYSSSALKFFEEKNQEIFPEEDFYMCTEYDKYGFVLEAKKAGEDIFCVRKTADED